MQNFRILLYIFLNISVFYISGCANAILWFIKCCKSQTSAYLGRLMIIFSLQNTSCILIFMTWFTDRDKLKLLLTFIEQICRTVWHPLDLRSVSDLLQLFGTWKPPAPSKRTYTHILKWVFIIETIGKDFSMHFDQICSTVFALLVKEGFP